MVDLHGQFERGGSIDGVIVVEETLKETLDRINIKTTERPKANMSSSRVRNDSDNSWDKIEEAQDDEAHAQSNGWNV